MAPSPYAAVLKRWLGYALAVTLACGAVLRAQESRISLEQLGQRKGADYTPLWEGRDVVVSGVVAAPVFHFADRHLLAIESGSSGALLRVGSDESSLDGFQPGDEIEASGKVVSSYGVPVVVPREVRLLHHQAPPAALQLSPSAAENLGYVGMLVRVEGRVSEAPGYNAGGAIISVEASPEPYRIYIPRGAGQPKSDLSGIHPGDFVGVAGIALQYAPVAPHNAGFEVVVARAGDIALLDRSRGISGPIAGGVVVLVALIAALMWTRERRLGNQRRKLRRTYQLGEEILSAGSAAAILGRLREALPAILGITHTRLYLYNRAAKTLDTVPAAGGEPVSISLSSPPGGTPAGAVACFHYRTLLVIPDIGRSPFPIAGEAGEHSPRSLLFVPMMAQTDVVGVLELDQDDRVRDFSADEQALAQHLGNQIGVAVRLLDQRSVQEQLFRSERLAAVGRLISGIVNELRAPLASIRDLAQRAADKSHAGPAEREVAAIASEAAKASAMVTRLVSFASNEQVEARPVDVNGLLRALIDFREGDWKASGIRVRDLTASDPIYVLGSHGQLEQVFLNLLLHAEQSLMDTASKALTVRTSLLARRLLVEISFSASVEDRKPEETAAVLGVSRSVVAGHGGEVRLIEKSPSEPRFEIELPAQARERVAPQFNPPSAAPVRESARGMTAILIETDEAVRNQLLALLSARGYRVVPLDHADGALDLAQRMRFDIAFCSLRAPGLNWVELSERLHSRVGAFVLLSEGYDAELTADFESEGHFVLAKPVQEADLERVLRAVEPRGATIIPFKTGTA